MLVLEYNCVVACVLSLELFYKAKNVPIDVDSGQSNKNNEVKKRGGGKVNCLQFIGGPI
jgi:hypothetical protein